MVATRRLHLVLRRANPTASSGAAQTGAPSASAPPLTWLVRTSGVVVTDAGPTESAAPLTREVIWRQARSVLHPRPQPVGARSAAARTLAADLLRETQSRGRDAAAEGRAWLDGASAGSARDWLRRFVDRLLASIDPREEALRRTHNFVQEARRAKDKEQTKREKPTQAQSEAQPNASAAQLTTPRASTTPVVPSQPTYSVCIHHPDDISSSNAASSVLSLLSARSSYHTRWLYINTALLPVTAAAAVLPGPNVFFAWNAFRLFGHYQARRGAEEMTACVQARMPGQAHAQSAASSDPALSAAANLQLVFEPFVDDAVDLSSLLARLGVQKYANDKHNSSP